MKQVMKDIIINNNDHVSLDTNIDDNGTKNNKVKESSTNINEEKENNSTSTKQSEKNNPDIATNIELHNSARCIEKKLDTYRFD